MKKIITLILIMTMLVSIPVFAESNNTGQIITEEVDGVIITTWEASPSQLKRLNALDNKGLTVGKVYKTAVPKVYEAFIKGKPYENDKYDKDSSKEVLTRSGSNASINLSLSGNGLSSYANMQYQAPTYYAELAHRMYDNNSGQLIASRLRTLENTNHNNPTIMSIDHTLYQEPNDGTYYSWAQFRNVIPDTGDIAIDHFQVENKVSIAISYDNPY